MALWLLKTEPTAFSYADLERLGQDMWDGVRNNAATKNIRAMRPGDEAFFYHTGDERAIVGICAVCSEPYPDPTAGDPRWVVVDVRPVRALPRTVTLAEIKADQAFAGWDLVRQARLSVLPVPQAIWDRILTMAEA